MYLYKYDKYFNIIINLSILKIIYIFVQSLNDLYVEKASYLNRHNLNE